jgi:hypothetical protein
LERDGVLSDNGEDRTPQILEQMKKFNAYYIHDSNYTLEFDSYENYLMWLLTYS